MEILIYVSIIVGIMTLMTLMGILIKFIVMDWIKEYHEKEK